MSTTPPADNSGEESPHDHGGPIRRLRQFLSPTGREVHIVDNPESAERLRKQLTRDNEGAEFDLFIEGSDEHIKALEAAREAREQTRRDLKLNNAEVYEQIENVHNELDSISRELDSLNTQGVALDANFDKFGYSAHIRTTEDELELQSLSSRTMSEADRRKGDAIAFFKKPSVKQYWHKGLIWRSSTSLEVAPFELFVDLVYVGIIAIIGDRAAEDPTGESLLRFAVTFILSYKLWSELTVVISWFNSEDIFTRVCVLIFAACLIGYTTNIENAFGSTYTELVSFYLANRIFEALYFIFLAFLIPMIRGALYGFALVIFIPSALWIASIHVDWPDRYALIWLAIPLDLFGNGIIVPLVRNNERLVDMPVLGTLVRHMQFYPAINIEHKTERMNAFVTLVFGYSVVALLYQSESPAGLNWFFGKAVFGLITAFVFNMLYFEIDSSNIYMHAIRRGAASFWLWQFSHLPFIMSFILYSGALAKLVLAHDWNHEAVEALAELSRSKSEEEISVGIRWFYCAGLGVSLFCSGLIAMSHDHKTLSGLQLRKVHRLGVRFAVSIILILLPLAHKLNSVQLVATTTGLVVFVLCVDLWGSTCREDTFWMDMRSCKYAAECKLKKGDLEAVRKGDIKDINELVKRQRGDEKAALDLS